MTNTTRENVTFDRIDFAERGRTDAELAWRDASDDDKAKTRGWSVPSGGDYYCLEDEIRRAMTGTEQDRYARAYMQRWDELDGADRIIEQRRLRVAIAVFETHDENR